MKIKMIQKNSERGFTLLEVLISIVILTIGLLGMGALSTGIIRGNKFSSMMTTANILAQDKIEDCKRQGFSALSTITEGYSQKKTPPEDPSSSVAAQFNSFKRDTIISVDTPATGMKTIVVTVYWKKYYQVNPSHIDEHSISLSTIIAK